MRDEDGFAISAPGGFSKECIARFTRRSFDRHLLLLPERRDVCRTDFKSNVAGRSTVNTLVACERLRCKFLAVTLDQSVHKSRIRIARSSPQSMIQVANDKSFVTEGDQPAQ